MTPYLDDAGAGINSTESAAIEDYGRAVGRDCHHRFYVKRTVEVGQWYGKRKGNDKKESL